jgi:hypothetical protein
LKFGELNLSATTTLYWRFAYSGGLFSNSQASPQEIYIVGKLRTRPLDYYSIMLANGIIGGVVNNLRFETYLD